MDEAARPSDEAERLYRIQAGLGLGVGIASIVAPRLLFRIFGMDPDQLNGGALFGWRLFALRNLGIAGAALAGNRDASSLITLVQFPDQVVFAVGARRGEIPVRSARMAAATSGAVIALGLAARTRE